MRSTKVLEVLIPPYALIHFQEELNYFGNVRVVILGNADLASDILVFRQALLYTGKESERKRLVRLTKSYGLNFKLPFSHWRSGREAGRVCTPTASTSRLGCSSAGSGGSSCRSTESDGGTGARGGQGRAGLPLEAI